CCCCCCRWCWGKSGRRLSRGRGRCRRSHRRQREGRNGGRGGREISSLVRFPGGWRKVKPAPLLGEIFHVPDNHGSRVTYFPPRSSSSSSCCWCCSCCRHSTCCWCYFSTSADAPF
ncbi:unnamed protein product, partial [Ectocarpus fasciculatus]